MTGTTTATPSFISGLESTFTKGLSAAIDAGTNLISSPDTGQPGISTASGTPQVQGQANNPGGATTFFTPQHLLWVGGGLAAIGILYMVFKG